MGKKGRLRWLRRALPGLLLLGLVVAVAAGFAELQELGALLTQVRLGWLGLALVVFLLFYVFEALTWHVVMRSGGSSPSFVSLLPVGLAKQGLDQVLPTAGLGGSLLVVGALRNRGAEQEDAARAMLFDLTGWYLGQGILLGVVAVIIGARGALPAEGTLLVALPFLVVFVLVPGTIVWLSRQGGRAAADWLRGWKLLRPLAGVVEPLPRGFLWRGWLMAKVTVLNLLTLLVQVASLGLVFAGIGVSVGLDVLLVGFMVGMVARTVIAVPGGVGAFEGGTVAGLTWMGVGVEAALTATLLQRAVTYWLPLIPGLILARREVNGATAEA